MRRAQAWFDRLYIGLDRRLRGWLTLLIRVGLAFGQDNGAVVSRSIAFYALFSLFPLLLLLVSFASSVLASAEAQQLVLESMMRYLPAAADLVQENIDQILRTRNTVGVVATVGLLWSASGVFSAVYRAVNRAWADQKSGRFLLDKLYGMVLVAVVGLLLVATTAYTTMVGVFQSSRVSLLGWGPVSFPTGSQFWAWVSAFFPALISVATLTILYRTMPRNGVTWRDVGLGGLVAGLAWEATRRLFTWYLANFARYSLVYGSVGAIIGFLLWSYLSSLILLLGAEFTAQHTAWRRAGCPLESRPPSQWLPQWSK